MAQTVSRRCSRAQRPRLRSLGGRTATAAPASPASEAAYAEGQTLFNAKNYAEAAPTSSKRAVAADPGTPPPGTRWPRRAPAYDHCTSAIAGVPALCELEPDKSEPYYGLGLCLRETGDRARGARGAQTLRGASKSATDRAALGRERAKQVLAPSCPRRAPAPAATTPPAHRRRRRAPAQGRLRRRRRTAPSRRRRRCATRDTSTRRSPSSSRPSPPIRAHAARARRWASFC